MLNEEEFLNAIAKLIRTHRNLKKLSCEKLAALSEIDYSSLNLIENRRQIPRSYTLYKILYALDLNMLKTEDKNISTDAERLINKIKLMDSQSQKSLLHFLDTFDLKMK
jgi:transcriptional regulator with XRE-family HTH domain